MTRAASPQVSSDPLSAVQPLVIFCLGGHRYALRLLVVERILRSVEIAPLPQAPAIVLGVVNVEGRLVPAVDVRRRFRLPPRELGLSDHLILAHTARRPVIVIADAVLGVIERDGAGVVAADAIAPGLGYVEGVLKLEDGLIFIHDLNTFLSLDEEQQLEDSLKTARR